MDSGQRIDGKPLTPTEAPWGATHEKIEEIMRAEDGPAIMRARLPAHFGAPESTIYYFSRAADIEAVLADDKTFSLSPYDDALSACAGDVRFMLGESTEGQKVRRQMIRQVVGWPANNGKEVQPDEAARYEWWTEKVRMEARIAAEDVLESLRRRRRKRCNIIREYGYFVTYQTAARVLGIAGPSWPSALVRAFMLTRNLTSDDWIALSGEQARCQAMTVWSHLIMGHIFANFQNRDGIRKTAASIASHELNAHIRRAIKQCEEEFEDHILAHMKAARSSFRNLSQDEYEDHMRMILFEFVGSIVMLVGISFGKLIDVLARNKAPPTRLAELMTGPDGERLLEEALRLNTTTRSLLRRATRRVEIGGVTLEPRDYAFLLTGAASAHPSEYRNTPDATVRYLNFGRQGGPHACFGQYWARAILIEMLLALSRATSLKAVDPVTGVRDFAGAPDYFAMEWDDWRQRGAEASSGKGRRP